MPDRRNRHARHLETCTERGNPDQSEPVCSRPFARRLSWFWHSPSSRRRTGLFTATPDPGSSISRRAATTHAPIAPRRSTPSRKRWNVDIDRAACATPLGPRAGIRRSAPHTSATSSRASSTAARADTRRVRTATLSSRLAKRRSRPATYPAVVAIRRPFARHGREPRTAPTSWCEARRYFVETRSVYSASRSARTFTPYRTSRYRPGSRASVESRIG